MTNDEKKYPFAHLGDKLRQARGPINKKEFAKLLGIPIQTYYRYEKGDRRAPETVLKLAELFNANHKPFIVNKDMIVRDEAPEYAVQKNSAAAEDEGLFGHVEDKEVEGVSHVVTVFAPKKAQAADAGLVAKFQEMLAQLLQSPDPTLATAIMSNLSAFASVAEKERQLRTLIISEGPIDMEDFSAILIAVAVSMRPKAFWFYWGKWPRWDSNPVLVS